MSVVIPQAASRSARARKSRRLTVPLVAVAIRLAMVSSVSSSGSVPATAGSCLELGQRRLEHVDVDEGRWPEAAPLDEDVRLRSTSLGCSTSPSGPNIATPDSPSWTSLSAISRLSTDRNSMPLNWIMSISIRPVVSRSSRLSIITSGSWWWKNAP